MSRLVEVLYDKQALQRVSDGGEYHIKMFSLTLFLAASGHTACLMAFSMRRWQMRSYCNGLTKHFLSLSFMCVT